MKSNKSRASQRSWDNEDPFDQVLIELAQKIGTYRNLSQPKFSSRFTKEGRARRETQVAIEKVLVGLSEQVRLRANFSEGLIEGTRGWNPDKSKNLRGELQCLVSFSYDESR